VEPVLRRATVLGLPGPDDSPGVEGPAASERERRVRDYRGVFAVLRAVAARPRGGLVGRSGFPPRGVVCAGSAHGGLAFSPSLQTERGVIPPDEPGLWPAAVAAVGEGSAL